MNDKLNDALADLIEKSIRGAEAVVEFGQREIPIVIEQLLMWHFIHSLVWFLVGVIFVAGGFFVLKKGLWNRINPTNIAKVKKESAEAYERGEEWTRLKNGSSLPSPTYDRIMREGMTESDENIAIVSGFSSATMLLFGGAIVLSNWTWIKIGIAPKLYLLEYGAQLIK